MPKQAARARRPAVAAAAPTALAEPTYSRSWHDPSSSSYWPTKLVFVLSSWNGTLRIPDQTRSKTWRTTHDPRNWCRNTSERTFIVYQRVDPNRPFYSANFGFEAGVVVQFIVDHYHRLPDVTVFMQDRPEQHNPQWQQWATCLLPNVSYAPMTHARLARLYRANAQTDPGTDADDALVEQCWRNFLDAFNTPLLMPREAPHVAYFQGATFAASRSMLQATSLASWRRAHSMLAGGDGRCHHGPLQWERLSTVRRPNTKLLDTPEARGKHTSANAFEALQHLIVGGMAREEVFSYDYCRAYRPNCPKSPCGHVRVAKLYVMQMAGRVEHERRRVRREYLRILSSVKRVAESSDEVRKEFSYLLGGPR